MGFRFRKSIKIVPGLRLNFGKNGLSSITAGRPGATVNLNRRGTKATVGLSGTGLSYSTERSSSENRNSSAPQRGFIWWWLIILAFVLYLLFR